MGATWAAIACKPWKVEPKRKQSLALNDGAAGDKFLLKIRPPDLFTINNDKNMIRLERLGQNECGKVGNCEQMSQKRGERKKKESKV
jgi:hypothetical protein